MSRWSFRGTQGCLDEQPEVWAETRRGGGEAPKGRVGSEDEVPVRRVKGAEESHTIITGNMPPSQCLVGGGLPEIGSVLIIPVWEGAMAEGKNIAPQTFLRVLAVMAGKRRDCEQRTLVGVQFRTEKRRSWLNITECLGGLRHWSKAGDGFRCVRGDRCLGKPRLV